MGFPVSLRNELVLGQCKLRSSFSSSAARTVKAGETMGTATGSNGGIHHLRAGWACQYPALANGCRAIVDVYLPGDVIGLDTLLRIRPLESVLTLTSVTVETIPAPEVLTELMADPPTALFVAWLLGERQRRTDRLLAGISGLDARGRIALMVLDFYTRLRRRKLITGSTFSLPLTQAEIGDYLGLTVVHVNRVLRSLRDERIVNLERHCVTVLNLDRLTSLAQNGGTGSSNTKVSDRRPDEAAD
jgi:CRP/FNR family transcriptional regulator